MNRLLLVAAAFLCAFANLAFFRNVHAVLPPGPEGLLQAAALAAVLACGTVLLLSLTCFRFTVKPVLIALFLVSAACAYFMDTYNVVIDRDMLVNAASTDAAETADLLTPRFFAYLALLWLVPSALVLAVRIRREPRRRAVLRRLALAGGSAALALLVMVSMSAFFASFIREHKPLRYYTNPLTPVWSAWRYASARPERAPGPPEPVGADARVAADFGDRELVVLVVGETARADHFSLNGYARETNPQLAREDVAFFSNVSACGTSTAISVPCMFALAPAADFDGEEITRRENLLDVLRHAGVNVLWRDNNSSSKHVADRVRTEDFRSPERNPVCDDECRDEGMLAGLQDYVDGIEEGDILIVLHQMGSHGPAYYKRYPDEFRRFEPTCDTAQLDECTREEIVNSYDNTIVFTDHFLARVIDFLRANDGPFETVMLYMSDHGESLGEGGLYLHGMPAFLAPEAQTKVPMIVWFGPSYDDARIEDLRRLGDAPLSHDNLFHTTLGIFEVDTDVRDPGLDLLERSRSRPGTAYTLHAP